MVKFGSTASGYTYRLIERVNKGHTSRVVWWKIPFIYNMFVWSKYPTMYLDPSDPFERYHEEGHVDQLYEKGPIVLLFKWLTRAGRLDIESYCTALRIKAEVDTGQFDPIRQLDYYAGLYPKNYHLWGYSISECRFAIRRKYERLVANGR